MKNLNQNLVNTIASELLGKKLEKFMASVAVINESLEKKGWIPRGSIKANSGFYQGCGIDLREDEKNNEEVYFGALSRCLKYGGKMDSKPNKFKKNLSVDEILSLVSHKTMKKHSSQFVHAWIDLCSEKDQAIKLLDAARPLPVITAIGLSPKVTKTLIDMNLDIDLKTITMCELDFMWVQAFSNEGEPCFNKDGSSVLIQEWFPVWPEGTVHFQSRFASGGRCHACGKDIPSRNYIPVHAQDKKKNQLVSLWLGCDCAKNIFGIKDLGIRQSKLV